MIESAFDYVIVGGGAAGCVLAARLAADTDKSVVLIERGRTDTNRWIHIPATFFKALQSQDAEAIVSEADPSLNDANYPVPQGRVLGGGSSVNGMIYMRGQPQDYDDWANRYGCDGWAYKDVLPVFIRQENNQRIDNQFHGNAGKLRVADPSPPHPVSSAVIEAAINAGIAPSDDFNGAKQEGVGWYQVTALDGQRQSSAHCFLKPELHRENLTLQTNVLAERIRFNNKRAVALEARNEDGSELLIHARSEIILTAGSFQSPKLLMLSGVGPRDQLVKHGITPICESALVGSNYQDHVGTPVTRELVGVKGLYGADKGLQAIKHGISYFAARRGLLTSNLLDAGACVDTSGCGRPDVQFNIAPFAPGAPGTPPLACHAVQVHPMTMRPTSRSRLGLKSSNPADSPLFESRALDTEADLDTLRRGVRLAQEIFQQSPLSELVGDEIWPGADVSTVQGSNTLDDAIRSQARTIFHPAGTCAMGGNAKSVLDAQLRVRGVESLRVADCSVMPALVSGNTNAPTMMIADRCADFILGG